MSNIKLSAGVEFGDSLGTFQDGVVTEVRGQQELDGGLDVLRAQGLLLLVSDQLGGLQSDLLEHVGDKGVNYVHTLLADTNVVGDALEHLVDVKGEGLEVLSLDSLLSSVVVLLSGGFTLDHVIIVASGGI